MQLLFLGTGAGIPSKERNVSSLILDLLQERNSVWMFDCGEGTQQQILHTSVKPRKIDKIFITHLHGDHIFGLPGFLSSRSFLGAEKDSLTIYGPIGVKQYVETALKVSKTHLTYPLYIKELTDEGTIFEDERFYVDVVRLRHNVKSFGYRITEKDMPGELQVSKLKELGIAPGPIYREIKENERTELPDGTVIHRKDVVGRPKKGRVVSIFGDTTYIPQHASFLKRSDVLVHEATFSKENANLAKEYYHSTTVEAATLAKKAEVKKLILTHISSRYQQNDIKMLLREAQAIFPETVIAEDFFTYDVKSEG